MTAHPFPLGRVLQHDPRSLAFPAAGDTIRSVKWRHVGPVLDQGQVGSCTGNAMAQALNTRPLHPFGARLFKEADALQLYSVATGLDGFPGTYPPDDTGSSGLAVAKAAQQVGYISGYTHAFGIEHALAALQNGPVLLGTDWHESMFEPNSRGYVIPSGPVVGGHEYLLIGYDTAGYVTCLNSWGKSWGLRGRFLLSVESLGRLLSEQGDATIPVP